MDISSSRKRSIHIEASLQAHDTDTHKKLTTSSDDDDIEIILDVNSDTGKSSRSSLKIDPNTKIFGLRERIASVLLQENSALSNGEIELRTDSGILILDHVSPANAKYIKSAISYVNGFEIDWSQLERRLHNENRSLFDRTHITLLRIEYIRFLELKIVFHDLTGIKIIASSLIDKIWSAHILDTKAYSNFCKKLFARYLENAETPTPHSSQDLIFHRPPDDDVNASQRIFQINLTKACYLKRFGVEMPANMWSWESASYSKDMLEQHFAHYEDLINELVATVSPKTSSSSASPIAVGARPAMLVDYNIPSSVESRIISVSVSAAPHSSLSLLSSPGTTAVESARSSATTGIVTSPKCASSAAGNSLAGNPTPTSNSGGANAEEAKKKS